MDFLHSSFYIKKKVWIWIKKSALGDFSNSNTSRNAYCVVLKKKPSQSKAIPRKKFTDGASGQVAHWLE